MTNSDRVKTYMQRYPLLRVTFMLAIVFLLILAAYAIGRVHGALETQAALDGWQRCLDAYNLAFVEVG